MIEGSPAAAKLARQVPEARPVTGRRPDERVVRMLPSAPTRSAAVALVRALGDALTDRRVAVTAWSAEESKAPGRARSPGECRGVAGPRQLGIAPDAKPG